ncbi:MAG: STAS domain-containing protein [Candidatus Kapabacteria bacterium]|nr:STAS domain-containing protein [Candidatus Kapabacteria bacterium]
MDFKIYFQDDITIIKILSKKFTFNNSNALRTKVEELISENNCLFLFDLSEVEYMDSSGLGVFVTIYKNLEQKEKIFSEKCKMVFSNVSKPIETIFSIFKMDTIVNTFNTSDEAISYLKNFKS